MKTKKQIDADQKFLETLQSTLEYHRAQLKMKKALPWKGEDIRLMIIALECLVGMDMLKIEDWQKEHN